MERTLYFRLAIVARNAPSPHIDHSAGYGTAVRVALAASGCRGHGRPSYAANLIHLGFILAAARIIYIAGLGVAAAKRRSGGLAVCPIV